MPVTPYSEPTLQEFTSIRPTPSVTTEVEQGTVLVGPHYDLTDLRDATGQLNAEAKIGVTTTSAARAVLHQSTRLGRIRLPIPSVDKARRIDESTMRVFGATGVNQTPFEIPHGRDEQVLRRGTASFVWEAGDSVIFMTDSNANWPALLGKNQVPTAMPSYQRPLLVVRMDGGVEFTVLADSVSSANPRTLVLIAPAYANGFSISGGNTNRQYELVYRPKMWDVEQAPVGARATMAFMSRPALGTNAEKHRYLDLFQAASTPIRIVGGASVPLLNVRTSGTIGVGITASAVAPNSVNLTSTSIAIVLSTSTPITVEDLNDLIQGATPGVSPICYLDETGEVSGSTIDAAFYDSTPLSATITESTYMRLPVYTVHVNGQLGLQLTPPGSVLNDYSSGYVVQTGTTGYAHLALNGREKLLMTPAGVTTNLLEAINDRWDDIAAENTSMLEVYVKSPFRFLASEYYRTSADKWRILTPAGTTLSGYHILRAGMGSTSPVSDFDPSTLLTQVDLVSSLLGTLGNRYTIKYELVWNASESTVEYVDDVITLYQAVSASTGYLTDVLTVGRLYSAMEETLGPDETALFGFEHLWTATGTLGGPQNTNWSGPHTLSPECFVMDTDVFFGNTAVASTLTLPISNEQEFSGGGFRAVLNINPMALFSLAGNIPVSVYVDFRALRLDTTAATSITLYNRRPDLVELTRDNYASVLGPPVPSNPSSVAAHEYYRVGGTKALWFLGVDEVDTSTDGHQYGTPEAIERAVELIVRRTGYNVGVLSYGGAVRDMLLNRIQLLGGTERVRLDRGLDFWMPLKSPSRYPDVLLESASYVGRSNDGMTLYTTGDFSTNEVAIEAADDGELFVVRALLPADSEAPVALGDGRRGWRVTSLVANEDPSQVGLQTEFTAMVDDGETLLFYKRGYALVAPNGTRNIAATAEAIAVTESTAGSMRLMKVLGDTATRSINGVEYVMGHELVMIGQTLGLLQQLTPTEPATGLEYFGIKDLTGTNETYTTAQIDLIRGAGVVIPTQEQAGARRCFLSSDVSSDMTNSYTINRCLHATDDLLSARIRKRTDILRKSRRIDQLLIDEVTIQIESEIEALRSKYDAINLIAVAMLTAEQQATYNLDPRRGGLFVQVYKKHPKINNDMILENIISF